MGGELSIGSLGEKCKDCKFAETGIDVRTYTLKRFCRHPETRKEWEEPPVCGWKGNFALYEKCTREQKRKTLDEVSSDFGYIFYDGLKAQIMSVMETQVDGKERLHAVKKLIENILSQNEERVLSYWLSVLEERGIKQ